MLSVVVSDRQTWWTITTILCPWEPHLFGLGLHSLHQLTGGHVHPYLTRDIHCSVHNHCLAEDETEHASHVIPHIYWDK